MIDPLAGQTFAFYGQPYFDRAHPMKIPSSAGDVCGQLSPVGD